MSQLALDTDPYLEEANRVAHVGRLECPQADSAHFDTDILRNGSGC